MKREKCGCRIESTDGKTMSVVCCRLHASAQALLDALKVARSVIEKQQARSVAKGMIPHRAEKRFGSPLLKIRNALAFAKTGRRPAAVIKARRCKTKEDALKVFWERVEKGSECWLWKGPHTGGYGRVSIDSKVTLAHRFSYEIHKGPIPDGFQIDHLCRNPSYVRPDHLEAVTRTENIRRAVESRRTEGAKSR